MANFSYALALEMDKQIVYDHIATATPNSVNQALRRYRKEGNEPLVALIEEGRKKARIARIKKAVEDKQ